MMGKRYKIALVSSDEDFLNRITDAIKNWLSKKAIIKTYDKSDAKLFLETNINKVKNRQFDVAIVGEDKFITSLILKRSCPELPVIVNNDLDRIMEETLRILA